MKKFVLPVSYGVYQDVVLFPLKNITFSWDSPFLLVIFIADFAGLNTEDPNCVVVGLAPSHFHYERINQAFRQAGGELGIPCKTRGC